nr:retrovirus-related Pol polyprotein from transposon TNT 1-94 [Tanacetum cinerariifolium]
GKENGVKILKLIVERPFRMGTLRETLIEGTEGAPYLGPERPRVYSDLTTKEKERYNADIRATNFPLQGLPKDIYSLINHYTNAKDMMQLNSKFVNNMLPEWDRFITAVKLNRGLRDSNYDQLTKPQFKTAGLSFRMFRVDRIEDKGTMHGVQVQLVIRELITELGGQDNDVDEDVDEQPVQDIALNVDNMFQVDNCDAFDFDVDEAPTAQTMFMANISFADLFMMKPVHLMIRTFYLRYMIMIAIRMLFVNIMKYTRCMTM